MRSGYHTTSHLLKDSAGNYLFGGSATIGTYYGSYNTRLVKYKGIEMATSIIKDENLVPLIFPNPANEYLNIESVSMLYYSQYQIYNSMGNLAAAGYVPGNGILTREFLGIPKGIYFIKFISDKKYSSAFKIEFY